MAYSILHKAFVDGSLIWQNDILNGLRKFYLSDGTWELYDNIPSSLYDSLSESKDRYPDKCCLVDDNKTSYTYRKFFELVDDFAQVLYSQYYVRKGSHVGLLLYNSIEFCAAFYAVNKLGAVVVPLPTKYKKNEIFSLIENADLVGIIYDRDFSGWFESPGSCAGMFLLSVSSGAEQCALPTTAEISAHFAVQQPGQPRKETQLTKPLLEQPFEQPFGHSLGHFTDCSQGQRSLEDTAILMFTSGTTSRSKGVCLSNYSALHAIMVYQKIFHITEADRTIIPVPIYHVTGLLALLGLFLHSGGTVYLHKFFNAERVLSDIEAHDITFLHGAPTVFSMLMEHERQWQSLPSLQILACGSANMPKAKIQRLHQWIPQAEFRTVYGLTETSSPATIFPEDASQSPRIGSSGFPVPGLQMKICGEDEKILPIGTPGSVLMRGSVITTGYYHLETETFRNDWLDTGDIGYIDAHGYLYIVDRKKDMINRGGEKVCSLDVENALYSISDIAEAAVVGIPDSLYGEVPAAMIKLNRGVFLTGNDIQTRLKSALATFQIPVKFIFAEKLPVTPNGKIDKNSIRQLLSQDS